MKLNILIPTVIDRRGVFIPLLAELHRQTAGKSVRIIFDEDNKEISVGAKRQKLLLEADAEYLIGLDSDDFPMPDYVDSILQSLDSSPDCVGFLIHMTTNGVKPQTCCHSMRYEKWANNVDGFDYVRNITNHNVVRRELALQVGYKDMRHGEDKEFADRLWPLLKTEVFIDRRILHYRYSTAEEHHSKYGITPPTRSYLAR